MERQVSADSARLPRKKETLMEDPKLGSALSVELPPAFRSIGVASGDYIDAIQVEVDRTLKRAGGNRHKAINLGFHRMLSSGLITNSDLKRLEKASLIVFAVDAGKQSHADGAEALDKLYLDAIVDPESSTMGTTIIGATYSARTKQTAQGVGLFGMLVGGLLTGGPGGALIGGLVGWTLGGGCKKD
jgi:hypothetical protein